jgi:hypothetical protein
MQPGLALFGKMPELPAIGFFTGKMGTQDPGYKATPGKRKCVPDDV